MDKRSLQKQRIIKYFVDATAKIIDEEGVQAVSVKRVAALAGYNSATLYHYFDNLNHLIFFTSLRHLKAYTQDLAKYIGDKKNTIEIYLLVWKCFATHCYRHPQFFHNIFFGEFDHNKVNESITNYYNIYSEELPPETADYLPMLLEENIHVRDFILLKKAAAEKYISYESIREINEMNVLIFEGMLDRMQHNHHRLTVEEAVKITLKYVKNTLMIYGVSPQIIQRYWEI